MREGRDAFFDGYRAVTMADVQLRLSEMYLLERRGYVIGKGLAGDTVHLMDRLDASAVKRNAVDTVVNDGGIFTGYFIGDTVGPQAIARRFELFFGKELSQETLSWLLAEKR